MMSTESLSGLLAPLPKRKPASEHIFEHLKQAITRGDIPPGSRIVERRIAETMEVSRTPVREAIHRLERDGLVTRQLPGGFVVTGLTPEEIEECFGIRAVLEGYAARLATVRHTPEQLQPLTAKIDLFEQHLKKDDLEPLTKINTELHDTIYELSGSPRLIKMINDLKDQIVRFRRIILKDRALALASHRDHRDMLNMMLKRKEKEVELLVREHILRGQTAVLKRYDNDRLKP
ncbi:MAG: GntR family transcriptional regulator [Pseudomonadota bacterium]